MSIKDAMKRLSAVGIDVNYALDSGVTVGGLNVSLARRSYAERGAVGLDKCLNLQPRSVLDVGSGGGFHAAEFRKRKSDVTCIDLGTSVYAKSSVTDMSLRVI